MSRTPASRTTARSLAALLPAVALAMAPLTPATAAQERAGTIPLVTGSSPEGISAGPRDTFFAGARADGAVYVGSTRNDKVRTLVPGRTGEVAVGLLYDAATDRVWVAGGGTGDVTAYDARSGRLLYTVTTGAQFLNDVAITPTAVYVTDSRSANLIVVPLGPDGALPAPGTFTRLPVTGDYVQPATGNGLNGIRALPTGDLLAVSPGGLFVIDPATGAADRVEVTGTPELTGGDGLVLDGQTLYVVFGANPRNSVLELALAPAFGAATVVREITDTDFDRPTTGALVGGDLYVVNGQFSKPATDPTEVVRIELP